jgi:hypothetical protein
MAIRKKTRRKRLRKLADKIVKHEDKFDMHDWFHVSEDVDLSTKAVIEKVLEKRRPICGTSGCAAGWAVILFGTPEQVKGCIRGRDQWADVAQELLGMSNDEADIFSKTGLGVHDMAHDLREMAKEGAAK